MTSTTETSKTARHNPLMPVDLARIAALTSAITKTMSAAR